MDMNGADHKKKARFRVGDTIFYIAGSYVEESIVTMVWKDQYGEIYYGCDFNMEWGYELKYDEMVPEFRAYKTKSELLKSL